jgi:enoyl-CoA hydratase/carnithine racemase
MDGSNGHGLRRSREGGLARLELAKPPRNLLDPERLHPRHALQNFLTGEPFDARRAYEIGIVNEVVGAGELWPAVERWAQLSVRAGKALPAGRRSFYRFRELSYDDALSASLEEFRGMFTATEHTTEAGERA